MVLGTTLSDHAPVILVLDSTSHSLSPRTYRIPDSIYSSAEVCAKVCSRIEDIWEREWDTLGDMAAQVSQALAESSLICQQEALRAKQQWWAKERGLRRDLASIQRMQQSSPSSEELRWQEGRARAMLEETTQRRSEFSIHASKSFWARIGDKMCREFFRTHG